MQCGHCGTNVPEGFTVCTGCGAHYRANYKAFLPGVMFAVGPFLWLGSQRSIEGWMLYTALAAFVFGIFMLRQSIKKAWYRQND